MPQEPIDYLAAFPPQPHVYRVPVDAEGDRRDIEVEASNEDQAVRIAEEAGWKVLESAVYDRDTEDL